MNRTLSNEESVDDAFMCQFVSSNNVKRVKPFIQHGKTLETPIIMFSGSFGSCSCGFRQHQAVNKFQQPHCPCLMPDCCQFNYSQKY